MKRFHLAILAAAIAMSAIRSANATPPAEVIGNYTGSETIVQYNMATGARTTAKASIILAINPDNSFSITDSLGGSTTGTGSYGSAGAYMTTTQGSSNLIITATIKKGSLKGTIQLGDTGALLYVTGKLAAKKL